MRLRWLVLLFTVAGYISVPALAQDENAVKEIESLSREILSAQDPCPYLSRFQSAMERLAGDNKEYARSIRETLAPMFASCKADTDSRTAASTSHVPDRIAQPKPNNPPQNQAVVRSQTPAQRQAIAASITRVALNSQQIELLMNLAQALQHLGHLYIEHRKGSILQHTNKKDDAFADASGFRRRESEDFIVYYRDGDMTRAQTTLRFGEEAKPRIIEVFNHFPEPATRNGEKLPIYLGSTVKEFLDLSHCPDWSAACVVHTVYDDGIKQTMYVSPIAYEQGSDAGQNVENYRRTITHELAHYTHFDLTSPANLQNLTSWLCEGLASYVAQEDWRLLNLEVAYRNGAVFPLRTLIAAKLPDALGQDKVSLFYSEAHSVIAMIESRYGKEALTDFVLEVSQRTTLADAARDVLHCDMDSLDSEWSRYLRQRYERIANSFRPDTGADPLFHQVSKSRLTNVLCQCPAWRAVLIALTEQKIPFEI